MRRSKIEEGSNDDNHDHDDDDEDRTTTRCDTLYLLGIGRELDIYTTCLVDICSIRFLRLHVSRARISANKTAARAYHITYFSTDLRAVYAKCSVELVRARTCTRNDHTWEMGMNGNCYNVASHIA